MWESPKGCLLFSFTLQMEDGLVVPLIQYVVSLAVTEAIKDVCDRNVSVLLLFIHGLVGALGQMIVERFQHTGFCNRFYYRIVHAI